MMFQPKRSACRYAVRVIGVGLFLSPWVGAQPAQSAAAPHPPEQAMPALAPQPAPSADATQAQPNGGARKAVNPAERNLARSYAAAAFTSLDEGSYETAVDQFGQAIALLDVPTLLVGRADALVHLSKWKEAISDYEAAIAYQLGPGDSASFANSQKDAATKLSALRERMPRLRIDSTTRQVTITVDEQPSTTLDTTGSLELNPGVHTVIVTAVGQSVVHTFEAKENEVTSLQAPQPPRPTPAPVVEPAPIQAPPPPPEDPGLSTEVIVSGAVTGALAVGAIVTGVMCLSARSDFNAANDDNSSAPYEDRLSKWERADTLGLVNTGLTAAAVAAAGVTTYFWIAPQFGDTSQSPQSTAARSPMPSGVTIGLSRRF